MVEDKKDWKSEYEKLKKDFEGLSEAHNKVMDIIQLRQVVQVDLDL
jgi:hypothetical protein